jgi:hypothetical protein
MNPETIRVRIDAPEPERAAILDRVRGVLEEHAPGFVVWRLVDDSHADRAPTPDGTGDVVPWPRCLRCKRMVRSEAECGCGATPDARGLVQHGGACGGKMEVVAPLRTGPSPCPGCGGSGGRGRTCEACGGSGREDA